MAIWHDGGFISKSLMGIMIVSLLYVVFAVIGLSFLILIHELGHYFMARHVGIRVETFAIGFGKPIYSWEKNGVKWQIGWIPFGGYVKFFGQEMEDARDPYEIPDGFFGKRPIDRIKVALAGPVTNIIFALLFFALLWSIGGREKKFSEFTHKIGWLDFQSDLYVAGIRPGDEILSYNGQPFQGAKDHLYAPLTSAGEVQVEGMRVDYATGEKKPFSYTVKPYPHPNLLDKSLTTTGILNSANYIIYDRAAKGEENPLPEGSPMRKSGIQYGDRLVWVDGDMLFSSQELTHLLNDQRVLLTIEREGKRLQRRVPRVLVQELKLDPAIKEELTDWQYEAHLNSVKLQKLYVLPYNLTNEGVVENELKFIDREKELEVFPRHPFAANEALLQPKDKIVAIDGTPIKTSYDLLKSLQEHRVNLIVERTRALSKEQQPLSWKEADQAFDQEIDWPALSRIANSIGSPHPVTQAGPYVLLNPVLPKMRTEFALSPEKQAWLNAELQEQKKEVERIEDPDKRAHALALLRNQEKELLLGLPNIQDLKVNYNPSPIAQFSNVFGEIWHTLMALVTGSLNPKWISGPIGIIQVVHDTSMISLKEALFWLGAISLNLGILNLLPIPVLDGGYILLSLFEMITGKRLPPKTLEKVVLPFAILLIALFIFLTYQDLTRIFTRFLPW